MQYIDGLTTLPTDQANHPLIIGTALHTALEKGIEKAIEEYYMSYPVITDRHVEEAMKLEYLISKVKLPKGEHEIKIENEHFIGFVDLLAPATVFKRGVEVPNQYDLYDFKYSNNISSYRESRQLHLYKYFWERENPGKYIRDMYYLFVPKANIKQKKTEDLFQFRERLQDELSKLEPELVQIEYDASYVIDFMLDVKNVLEADEYPKNKSYLCNWCEFQEYCEKGRDYMLLPKNERRSIGDIKKRKIWLYGAPFSGKTTMLEQAPDPLNLNTDGNIEFVTMPYIPIKDKIVVEGRITKKTFAWEVLKEVISELEKKQNDFKTIIIDLLEDTREMCRLYKYDEMGIQHESDSGYGKGWDIIKTDYLSTIRRIFNLDYENIVVISHEDVSKDITKKNGQNITRVAPSIQDAIANKVAGMVDIVARVVVEDDGSRTLNFKSNEVVFGGGRLKGIKQTTIPLSWESLMQVYDDVNKNNEPKVKEEPKGRRSKTPDEEITETDVEEVQETPEVDSSAQKVQESEQTTEPEQMKLKEPEPEKLRTRRRRSE